MFRVAHHLAFVDYECIADTYEWIGVKYNSYIMYTHKYECIGVKYNLWIVYTHTNECICVS